MRLKVFEIILALLIPLLSGFIDAGGYVQIIVGVLGVIVAAIAGLMTLVKYQENWFEYRTVAETLKYEKFLFLAKTGPYKSELNPFPLFVERFESAISVSTKRWMNLNVAKKETENNRPPLQQDQEPV